MLALGRLNAGMTRVLGKVKDDARSIERTQENQSRNKESIGATVGAEWKRKGRREVKSTSWWWWIEVGLCSQGVDHPSCKTRLSDMAW